jgi:hypothetical protein
MREAGCCVVVHSSVRIVMRRLDASSSVGKEEIGSLLSFLEHAELEASPR